MGRGKVSCLTSEWHERIVAKLPYLKNVRVVGETSPPTTLESAHHLAYRRQRFRDLVWSSRPLYPMNEKITAITTVEVAALS